MRIAQMLRFDVRFQFRHGFYYAYLFISFFYIAILRVVPEQFRVLITTIVVFSDPSVFGFFFIGGILLLERGEKTLESLFVTPLRLHEYFVSKILSLSLIAVATSLLIAFSVFGLRFNLFLLLLGVALSSAFFVALGLGVSSQFTGIGDYLIRSPLYILAFFLPLLELNGFLDLGAFSLLVRLLPSYGGMYLIEHSLKGGAGVGGVLAAISSLLLWTGLGYLWASGMFKRHVIFQIGGGRD